jgi:hypothetical protein
MPTPRDYSAERLADRAQIQDVMYRWCRAVDRLDYDAIRTVFHADAIDTHGIYNGGIDGLIDWIKGRHKTIPFSMHSISNMLIEFGGPDSAVAETYCFAVQRYPAEGKASLAALAGGAEGKPGVAMDLMACARYVDRFERRGGEWRIQHRTVVYDSTMMYEVSPDAPKMGEGWTVGRRDKDDHVYRARAEVGVSD